MEYLLGSATADWDNKAYLSLAKLGFAAVFYSLKTNPDELGTDLLTGYTLSPKIGLLIVDLNKKDWNLYFPQ